jgi:hypothetical protein
MNFFEQCKQCSVMLDGGSGVLFQPMTEDYTYILTAKHNLYNESEAKSINDMKYIRYRELESKNILEKYEHSTLDIAILKIEKIDFESPYKEFEQPNNRDIFKFYGYPKDRRDKTEKIKYFDLKVGDKDGFEITASNQEYFPQSYIVGCSGGGVFKQDGDNFYLVGIEHSMDAQSEDELKHNVSLKYININAFDEIVAQFEDELEPLYPPYMSNFNLLVEDIFLLNDYEEKRNSVRDRLMYLSKSFITRITPIAIKNKFENDLLINGFDINHVTSRELWQMYLEFILLSILIDDKEDLTLEKIQEIYKKRKILFAKADRWIELKEEILKSNLLGLQKDSTVFIACEGDRRPPKVDLTNSILNISRPPQPEEMRIDQGIDYTVDIKYKHIYAIEKLLLDNEEMFANPMESSVDEILKKVLQNVCK